MKIDALTVGAFESNCYLIEGTQNRVLVVDPGADADAIRQAIATRRLQVAVYLLTHGHVDHIAAIGELHDAWPAPVAIHAADGAWAFSAENDFPPYYSAPRKPVGTLRPLQDGDTCEDAGLVYRVIGTPGHSPGSVCLYFDAAGALFTGDTLFAGSVGRTDFPGGDTRRLQRSLRLLAALPDDTRIYPGHGPASTIGQEKASNVYLADLRV